MAKELERGDVVQLKSGGPKMTINGFTGHAAICVWFVGTTRQTANFALETLEAVGDSDEKAK